MSDPLPIVCKPTRWFVTRACVILLMFAVFAVLFYIDGSTGYRKKNQVFYLNKTFQHAVNEFSRLDQKEPLTAESWKTHAQQQSALYPDDPFILPAGLVLPAPWPDILTDFDQVKDLQWNKLWLDYSARMGYPAEPPEQPFDRRKIHQQWVVFYVCIVLVALTSFFLLRTIRRSISADTEAITSAEGKRIHYTDIKRLDLRKWDTKGIAIAEYDGADGSGRIRIDGLTYGGFRKDQGEPAEKLMQLLRSHFSGEIIEYAIVTDTENQADEVRAD